LLSSTAAIDLADNKLCIWIQIPETSLSVYKIKAI